MINKTIDDGRYRHGRKTKEFENSWSITYRKPNYDALGDPHASYYFLNKSMRKHLASLRKSIDKEGAYVEKKKIKNMITERIKDYDNDNRVTKVEAYYFKMGSSPSISSLGSIRSRKSLLNQTKDQRKKQQPQSEELTKEKSKTLQVKQRSKKQKSPQFQLPKIVTENKQSEKPKQPSKLEKQESKLTIMNKTEHNKFLKFILERKKKLSLNEPAKKPEPRIEKEKTEEAKS